MYIVPQRMDQEYCERDGEHCMLQGCDTEQERIQWQYNGWWYKWDMYMDGILRDRQFNIKCMVQQGMHITNNKWIYADGVHEQQCMVICEHCCGYGNNEDKCEYDSTG